MTSDLSKYVLYARITEGAGQYWTVVPQRYCHVRNLYRPLSKIQQLRPETLSCRLTYLLIPWSRVLPEQLTGLQLVKKFPAFHGTRKFITALTSVRHLSLSWASPVQSTCPMFCYAVVNNEQLSATRTLWTTLFVPESLQNEPI